MVVDEVWIRAFIIVVTTTLSSGGFWAYLQKKERGRKAPDRLLMGLAYAQLMQLGEAYMMRGWITRDELADYLKYFYTPYKELGGNGVAERIMDGVRELPIRSQYNFRMAHPHEEYTGNVRVSSPSERTSIE